MPGTRLSQAERSLISDWQKGNYRFPRLAQLVISGAGGLRGIHNLSLNCDRPITAICGPSGVGKSTLLELCALAFRPKHATSPAQVSDVFDRQFRTAAGEAPFADFEVTWRYSDDTPPAITLHGADRSLSGERPARTVVFINAARMVPSRHKPSPATTMSAGGLSQKALLPPYVKRLSDVLQRPYMGAGWQETPDDHLATCETTAPYTGFNMSFAEENIIEVFRQIQVAGTSALVVIEDIDAGLLPVTCERLARHLVEMCKDNSLQIILSARSKEFLDALPRQFRTLVEFDGAGGHVVEDEAPMWKVQRATGSTAPTDLLVFCEDDIAEAIILQTVEGELRRRMKIVRGGSKNELAQFAITHHRANWGYKILIVWDGDVTEAEVNGWLRRLNASKEEQQALSRIQLPGPQPPERWLIDQLLQHAGASLLAQELNEGEREAQLLLNALTSIAEHHKIFYELAQRTGLDMSRVLNGAIRATRRLAHQPLALLGTQIAQVARGERTIEIGKLSEGAS